MKPPFVFILIFYCHSLSAQYKKVPDIYKERKEVNHQILKGGFKGFDVAELGLLPDGGLDTTAAFHYEYYPSGLIKETRHYDYVKWDEIKNIRGWKKLSKLKEGERTMYTYDAKGNMLSKRTYLLAPANSYLALLSMAAREDNEEQEERENPKYKPKTMSTDSLLDAGIPGLERVESVERYTYNKDGNRLYSEDSIKRTEIAYSYSYNRNKQVAVEHKSLSPVSYHAIETHFGYDDGGNPEHIIVYECRGDSAKINAPENITYETLRKYNSKNKITEEAYSVHSFRSVTSKKLCYVYKDSVIISAATLNASNDTDEVTISTYNKINKLSEAKNYAVDAGKRYLRKREEYDYDSAGNISEVRYFEKNGDKEILYKKELFYLYR